MAPHAYWKGYIRLSLVSFPVRLYAAVSRSDRISLHQYDRETGERIHYQKVNEEGKAVPDDKIIRGYEFKKNSYVPIEDNDLEKLKLESKHTIDLVQFTKLGDVDPVYFDRPYYVAPDGDIATEAFLTLRDALRKTEEVAIGQVVLSGKEQVVALRPCGRGLVMYTLRYASEVREAEDYFGDIPEKVNIEKEQLALATQLIKQKTSPFEPQAYKDHYQQSLLELIEAKIKGEEVTPASPSKGKPKNVVNIVEALKQSLAQSDQGRTKSKKKKKSGQRVA